MSTKRTCANSNSISFLTSADILCATWKLCASYHSIYYFAGREQRSGAGAKSIAENATSHLTDAAPCKAPRRNSLRKVVLKRESETEVERRRRLHSGVYPDWKRNPDE